jgi:hypothetical protein
VDNEEIEREEQAGERKLVNTWSKWMLVVVALGLAAAVFITAANDGWPFTLLWHSR